MEGDEADLRDLKVQRKIYRRPIATVCAEVLSLQCLFRGPIDNNVCEEVLKAIVLSVL